MPLESQTGIVLSGASHHPCADPGDGRRPMGGRASGRGDSGLLPAQTARFALPTIELSHRLADLMAASFGLAEGFPDLIWRAVPDPLPTCAVLDGFIAQLEAIEERASAAKATCLFLWEISSAEASRKRESEGGTR